MSTIFTKIITGEIPSHKVAEDENHIAFLDIHPLATGHTLVVPKKEQDYIFDLTEADYTSLNLFAMKVAKGLRQAIVCKRIGVAVIGLEVPHVHIHLVPMNEISDINFSREKLNPSQEELEETALKIRSKID